MIIFVVASVILWMLLGFALFQMRRMCRWMDEREKYMQEVLIAAYDLGKATSATRVRHSGQISGEWVQGRFGPNGPKQFVPSSVGLEQINLAMEIMETAEILRDELTPRLLDAVGAIKNWERQHPCPSILEALQ